MSEGERAWKRRESRFDPVVSARPCVKAAFQGNLDLQEVYKIEQEDEVNLL